MERRNNTPWLRIVLRLSAAILVGSCTAWSSGMFGSYATWQRCGPIQIVAGPDEAWCFVEIDRVVHRPAPLASPRNITMGHWQEVVVLSREGVKERIPVSVPDGVTFHPNISHIFRLDGEFYLYESMSGGNLRSVYRWKQDHFELLALAESEGLLKAHGLDTVDPIELNDHPPKNGDWRQIYQQKDWFLQADRFRRNDQPYEIELIETDKLHHLKIRSLGDDRWQADLAEIDSTRRDISRAEHEELWRRPQQRGHPR